MKHTHFAFGLVAACLASFGVSETIAHAKPDAIQLSAALEVGSYQDELKLQGALDASSSRDLWFSFLAIGVGYALPSPVDTLRLRGQSSVGVGVTYALGDFPMLLRQEARAVFPLDSWLALQLGVGAGFQFDFSNKSQSFFQLGLPLGVELFECFEVLYSPMFTFPILDDERRVFGGVLRHRVESGIAPLNFVLRLNLNVF